MIDQSFEIRERSLKCEELESEGVFEKYTL